MTGIFENRLYDGIPEMLQNLKASGYVLAIASSKPTVFVEQILEHFHIKNDFDNVTGSFLDGRRTKKSEVIEAVVADLGISDRGKALMIGDRYHEVEGAKEAGMDCVGVAFGYGGRQELEAAGAVAVVDSVEALREWLLAGK